MNAIKALTSCSCRRRTLLTRLCPALLQVVVVIAIWWIIKSQMTSSVETRDISGGTNGATFDQSKCYPPGFTQAKTLRLLNLSSILSTTKVHDSTSDVILNRFLAVNVYVHDVIKGSVVLYPAGSMMQIENTQGVKIDDSKKDSNYVFDDSNKAKGVTATNNVVNSDVNADSNKLKVDQQSNVGQGFPRMSEGGSHQYPDYDHGNTDLQKNTLIEKPKTVDNPSSPNQNLGTESDNGGDSPKDSQKLPENDKQFQDVKSTRNEKEDELFDLSNRHASSEVQGSNNEPVNPLSEPSLNEEIKPLLVDGFTDRARKFMSEMHGPNVRNISKDDKTTNYPFTENRLICQGLFEIDLLYLINSKPESSDLRRRIRDTFVRPTNFQPSVIVHVFLLGKAASPNLQQTVHQEQGTFRDLVQGDFQDVPHNSTYKGLMGMRWMSQFCPQAKYIMTINEDVFVDTDKLIHGLIPATKKVNDKKFILCYFNSESPISRTGPDAFSENIFPGRLHLRPYCKGFAILMNQAVIPSLLAASEHVRPFVMDELYLYGILPFVAGGVAVYDVGNKRAFHNFGMETVTCYQQKLDKCPFVASVAFSERFTLLWDSVKARLLEPHQGWEDDKSLWNIPSYIRRF
uniref:Hexosyltransferase n=1 Tax=Arion vulgaris TaxID=1028688 RepID=A0A0B6ZQE0_9EUPU